MHSRDAYPGIITLFTLYKEGASHLELWVPGWVRIDGGMKTIQRKMEGMKQFWEFSRPQSELKTAAPLIKKQKIAKNMNNKCKY